MLCIIVILKNKTGCFFFMMPFRLLVSVDIMTGFIQIFGLCPGSHWIMSIGLKRKQIMIVRLYVLQLFVTAVKNTNTRFGGLVCSEPPFQQSCSFQWRLPGWSLTFYPIKNKFGGPPHLHYSPFYNSYLSFKYLRVFFSKQSHGPP